MNTKIVEILLEPFFERVADTRDECREVATEAIQALSDAGYVIVPRKPTPDMWEEGNIVDGGPWAIWATMIAAFENQDTEKAPDS